MENPNDFDKSSYRSLENYVAHWKIFIDTCSVLDPCVGKFWANVIPLLDMYHKSIIFPYRCYQELEKHASNNNNPDLAKKAKQALKEIDTLVSMHYVEIRGEKGDHFADHVFRVVFSRFCMQYKMLLITQDNNLAKDILKINDKNSEMRDQVRTKRLNKFGFLSNYSWNKYDPSKIYSPHFTTTLTTISDTPMTVKFFPHEGDVVKADHNEIHLVSKLAEGGEGIIYKTNTPYLAKIYKENHNSRRTYEKIKLMVSKYLVCEGVCLPHALLYNARDEFVGYLMPEAKGVELSKSIFIKPLFMKHFPNWKKRDTVQLCITILEKIQYLHNQGIILGDINPNNILVVSPTEVYFVDTDSYQIGGFPCPVGTIVYTAPEIQDQCFSTFLRSEGNENFAIATLLFMIMLPGKPPYSQQGGESLVQNIMSMDFSYPFGPTSNKKTPAGPWRYIWSHLPYKVKGAFFNTFAKNGTYAKEENRLSVAKWLSLFRSYLHLLDDGLMVQQDQMSVELFPTRFKYY